MVIGISLEPPRFPLPLNCVTKRNDGSVESTNFSSVDGDIPSPGSALVSKPYMVVPLGDQQMDSRDLFMPLRPCQAIFYIGPECNAPDWPEKLRRCLWPQDVA